MDRFSELLSELSKIFLLPLKEDHSHACSIQVPPLTIQIELDPSQEQLFLFSKIIEIPPGGFRENVLAEALKTNGLPEPRSGILSYQVQNNTLCLHQNHPASLLDGRKLSELFAAFFEMGESWHRAIQSGRVNP